jgi:hypothetical protein
MGEIADRKLVRSRAARSVSRLRTATTASRLCSGPSARTASSPHLYSCRNAFETASSIHRNWVQAIQSLLGIGGRRCEVNGKFRRSS